MKPKVFFLNAYLRIGFPSMQHEKYPSPHSKAEPKTIEKQYLKTISDLSDNNLYTIISFSDKELYILLYDRPFADVQS